MSTLGILKQIYDLSQPQRNNGNFGSFDTEMTFLPRKTIRSQSKSFDFYLSQIKISDKGVVN